MPELAVDRHEVLRPGRLDHLPLVRARAVPRDVDARGGAPVGDGRAAFEEPIDQIADHPFVAGDGA
jgi:hypothetical protein